MESYDLGFFAGQSVIIDRVLEIAEKFTQPGYRDLKDTQTAEKVAKAIKQEVDNLRQRLISGFLHHD